MRDEDCAGVLVDVVPLLAATTIDVEDNTTLDVEDDAPLDDETTVPDVEDGIHDDALLETPAGWMPPASGRSSMGGPNNVPSQPMGISVTNTITVNRETM